MGRPNKGPREAIKARAPLSDVAAIKAAAKRSGKTLSDYLVAAALALATQAPALAIVASEAGKGDLDDDQSSETAQESAPEPAARVPALLQSAVPLQCESGPPLLGLLAQGVGVEGVALDSSDGPGSCVLGAALGLRDSAREVLSEAQPELPSLAPGEARDRDVLSSPVLEEEPVPTKIKDGRPAHYCDEPSCSARSAGFHEGRAYCSEHLQLLVVAEEEIPELPEAATRGPCLVCGARRFTVRAGAATVEALPCEACAVSCLRCLGSGYYLGVSEAGYPAQVVCECGEQSIEATLAALRGAEIPAVYAAELYGKLPPRPISESQRAAQVAAFEWSKTYLDKGGRAGLFFSGPPGTGKTLALCRALALCAKHGRSVRYLNLPVYLGTKKDSFAEGAEVEVGALQEYERAEVLLIDEILLKGRSGQLRALSDWERSQLDSLVQARWNAGKPTLFATNYSPREIEQDLSESTWSRIKNSTRALEVSGGDLRERPVQKRGIR